MENIFTSIEYALEELFTLESIIKFTKEACLEKEFASIYYEIPESKKNLLSEERNHYINMLTIALDKLTNIKNNVFIVENETCKLKQYTNNCSRQITA